MPANPRKRAEYSCGLEAAFDVIGGKWKVLILWQLHPEPRRFGELKRPERHPKWREVNLAAGLPGWTRAQAADDWLAGQPSQAVKPAATTASVAGDGAAPPSWPASTDQKEALFKAFVDWQRTNNQ